MSVLIFNKTNMRIILTAALLSLLFFSCKSTKQSTTEQISLFGTRWEVQQIDGTEVKLDNNSAFLIFKDDEEHSVSGSTSCNGMSGSYTLSDNNLSFSPMMMTYRGCVGNSVEREFLNAISRVKNYRFSDNALIFLDGETEIMIFKAVNL